MSQLPSLSQLSDPKPQSLGPVICPPCTDDLLGILPPTDLSGSSPPIQASTHHVLYSLCDSRGGAGVPPGRRAPGIQARRERWYPSHLIW